MATVQECTKTSDSAHFIGHLIGLVPELSCANRMKLQGNSIASRIGIVLAKSHMGLFIGGCSMREEIKDTWSFVLTLVVLAIALFLYNLF